MSKTDRPARVGPMDVGPTLGGTVRVGPIPLDRLEPVGDRLVRPECVVALASGEIVVPDWRGGITRIRPDGEQETCLAQPHGFDLKPNGVALAPDGSFLLANLGDAGGVWRLESDGRLSAFVTAVDGVPLPPANFVIVDAHARTWISCSTRHVPRQQAWRPTVADGFVVLADARGARIVADGLHYTNEVRPDPSGAWLYAVETFGRRVVRFPIGADGNLGASEIVVTLGRGCFPDGIAFDDAGGLWVTSLISNRLLRVYGDDIETVIEDANAAYIDAVEEAFASGRMDAAHLGNIPDTTLQQVTSLAFGGADRRTVYLGSLHATCLYRFRSPIAGAREAHWDFPLR